MLSLIDKLPIVQKFIHSLSWKNIAQLALFLFVIAVAYATYDNKDSIYNFVNQDKLQNIRLISKLSTETQLEIDAAVNRSDLIVAVHVSLVDFQKNLRTPIYVFTDAPELVTIYKKYDSSTIPAEFPVFNSDQNNNKMMVDLINGQLACIDFKDTTAGKYMPEAAEFSPTVCSTGIPPFYGRFTGIVAVHLKRSPTIEEIDQIRSFAKKVAATIYDRDIN